MKHAQRPTGRRGSLLFACAAFACSGPAADPVPDFDAPAGTVSGAGNGLPIGLVEEDAALREMASCGGLVLEAERPPLDMYFLVDSSGSMAERAGGGADKWALVTEALTDFLSAPLNTQLNAGIGYFPVDASSTCSAGEPGCLCIPFINLCLPNLGGSCATGDYTTPAVPLSLPPAPARVIDDLSARDVAGGTPTAAALGGTYRYLETWSLAHPGRQPVAVLATDGEPTGCADNDTANVAALARSALLGPQRIQTFVIGVGPALEALDQVAAAGGTERAFLSDTPSDLQADFASALDAIRNRAATCSFSIPEATDPNRVDSGRVDPGLVNVRLTPAGSNEATWIGKTPDGTVNGCGARGGWFYDDPGAPTRIQLCDATCDGAAQARLEIELGCRSAVQPLR